MSESNKRMSGPLARRAFLGSAAAGAATLFGGGALLALDRLSPRHRAVRPFGMAVIGDSIMWGQGLREKEKFWFKTQEWLAHELRRPLSYQFFAHSGALIEPYAYLDAQGPLYGEIPSPSPSVIRQAQYVKDPTDIDFVLVNGGANDVVLGWVLSPEATPERIADRMRTKCGERMQAMLCYLVGYFPNARFAVTGYYPLVSAKSFAATDALAALAALFQQLYGFGLAEANIYAEGRAKLLAKSYAFANESTKWLQRAVDETNALFPNRIVFAKPAIDGDRCLLATDSHIWGLEDDPVKPQRITQCQATGRLTLIDFETMNFGNFDIECALASLMHPNAKGAQRYFEALIAELPKFFPFWRA